MRQLRKAVAVFLTMMFFICGMGSSLPVQAAGDSYSDKLDLSMERGIESKDAMEFKGTNAIEISESGDLSLIQNNIKNVNSLKISITFELKSDFSGSFFNLFEISNSAVPTEQMALILGTNGVVYWMTGAKQGSTDWKPASGKDVSSGQHTLTATISKKEFKYELDGISKSVAANSSDDTTKFVKAFFGEAQSETSYRDWRESIDSVVIGGLRTGSYQAHTNFKDFQGTISSLTIAGFNDLSDLTGEGFFNSIFESSMLDNTWLFGGGVETQGRFEEVGGHRNYIGHFEEYIRWEKRVNGIREGMQRYTINVGKENQDAIAFAEGLDTYIEKVDPRAVAYLIGPEDYGKGQDGIAEFKEAISAIIHKALAMKDDTGCAVIQTPHAVKDESMAVNASLYAAAAAEVYNEIVAEKEQNKDHMAFVDHLSQTDTNDFKSEKLTEDGLLNDKGHYEIGKQLAQATYGSSAGFPTLSDVWAVKPAAEIYVKETPEAEAGDDSLTVTIPEEIAGTEWSYRLTTDGMEICGTAEGNPFTITGLPEGKTYELTVCTGDGKTQLSAVAGTISYGEEAKPLEEAGDLPQKIRQMADDMDTPLTWLFMGDSITHGAMHTAGYDSIAQVFEKYVKEDLGRTDDIVINTAVSGATAERTCENIYERMTKYKPDIVSIMLGTNDKGAAVYEAKMQEIVTAIRTVNPNAVIIFRTPIPAKSEWASASVMESVVAKMKNLAQTDGNILFIDQYTDYVEEWKNTYPYLLNGGKFYMADGVHGTGAGHLLMTKLFIRECGLDTNTRITNFDYEFNYAKETNDEIPTVTAEVATETEPASITVTKETLQALYSNGTIGDFTITLTAADGTSYTKNSGLDGEAVTITPAGNRRYLVEIEANIKGSTAKKVTFGSQEILLLTEEATDYDMEIAEGADSEFTELGEVTAEDVLDKNVRDDIKYALETYDSLTDVQKALVSSSAMQTLRVAADALDTYEANAVSNQIRAIGTVTAEDIAADTSKKTNIEAARKAYNKLTAAQQKKITSADLKILTDAEAAVAQYEEDQKKPPVTPPNEGEDPSGGTENPPGGAGDPPSGTENPPGGGGDPQKPDTYEKDNYIYAITGEQTAEVKGLTKETAKITIPSTVDLDGKIYKVTSIAASAFKGNKKVTTVTIGKNMEVIGKSAFANCKKLKKVTISSKKLKTLGNKAFFKCKALKNVTIKSKVLKSIGKQTFKGIHKQATIKISSGKSKAK